jgi:hypothetical protein
LVVAIVNPALLFLFIVGGSRGSGFNLPAVPTPVKSIAASTRPVVCVVVLVVIGREETVSTRVVF